MNGGRVRVSIKQCVISYTYFYDTINAIKRCNVNELYGGACFVYTTLVK